MAKHAVVIIDMLNDFIHPDGALTCPNGTGIVPAIQELIRIQPRE